jgi:hypothetical protein
VATNRWLGHAPAIAKVVTLVVGSNTAGHTFITTINGKSITVTANGTDTAAQIASAIQELLSASTIPEFQEVTWTVDSATITGTAATAGVPFTVSKSGTGTYTLTTVTNSSGPNDASITGNWSQGTLPAATEDVLIDVPVDILYGLESIAAAAYASFRVKASFTGRLGLPYFNETGYVEYRTRFWPIDNAVPVAIGEGDGAGPVRVNLAHTTAMAVTVHKTGDRELASTPVVNLKSATSGTLDVVSGDVGLAADDDTTACTVTTATINETATLTVGKGATVTTLDNDGGDALGYGTITTLNSTVGNTTLFVAPTTITADGGTVYVRYTGTTTTVTARGQGPQASPAIDCSLDSRARTWTNLSFTGGAALNDPDKTTTWTNAGTFDRESLAASDLGSRFSLQRT